MPITKKPAISEQRVADRSVSLQVSNIRQRIEAIEGLLATVESQANQTTFNAARSSASLSSILARLSELESSLGELEQLFGQDDGLVVLSGGNLITRTLEAGTGIAITYPDGVSGNPIISTIGSDYPFLTTEDDDDILTESGHRIRIES